MMKNSTPGVLIALVAIALSVFSIGYAHYTKPRIAFVDMGSVYDGFVMKKEYDQKLQDIQQAHTQKIDSIEYIMSHYYQALKSLPRPSEQQLDSLRKLELLHQYRVKQQEETIQKLSQEYNEQVWERINQYISEFGEKHNYKLILGANGMGSIMYGADTENITKESIDYINAQFEALR